MLQLLLVTGANKSLGISDEWFAMGDSLVLTVLGQVCLGFSLSRNHELDLMILYKSKNLPVSSMPWTLRSHGLRCVNNLQVSFMPVLVLAARLCPPGVEATLFATLMSISNGGGVTGGVLGAGLTQFLGVTSHNFDNLVILILLCNASSLFPLAFLNLLPSGSELESTVEKADKARRELEITKQD